MNRYFFSAEYKKRLPKKTFGGPPLSGAQLASDLVFVGAKMTPFLSPECLFYQRFLHILVIFGCPQRSAAPGPAAASDLVFVGPQNDSILSPKCLFYQRFLHILVIFWCLERLRMWASRAQQSS